MLGGSPAAYCRAPGVSCVSVSRPRWTPSMMSATAACQTSGTRVGVAVFGPGGDGLDQVGDAGEHAATQAPVGQVLELALDQVQPGTGRGVKCRCQRTRWGWASQSLTLGALWAVHLRTTSAKSAPSRSPRTGARSLRCQPRPPCPATPLPAAQQDAATTARRGPPNSTRAASVNIRQSAARIPDMQAVLIQKPFYPQSARPQLSEILTCVTSELC